MSYKIKSKSSNKQQKNKFSKKNKTRKNNKNNKKSKKNYRGSGPSWSKHSYKCDHDLTHSGVSTMKIDSVTGHPSDWRMHLECTECDHKDSISCFNKKKPRTLQECQEH
jgi:hypothetical protein